MAQIQPDGTVLATKPITEGRVTLAAASTQTTTISDIPNYMFKGLKVVVDITAISGVGATLTVTLQGKDPLSGKVFTLLASAGLTATGTTVLNLFPGAAVSANVSANDQLPSVWNIKYVIAGTTPSVTGTISPIGLI